MDLDRYNLAAMLFERVTALPAAERESFLNRETGDDQELAARVRRMVRFAEQCGSTSPLLAGGIANGSSNENGSDFQPQSLVGAAIGNFTIEALLGEGGFGVVYRASQTLPVRRSVAIKILKIGMDSQRVIARFEAERQALAMMEHPHIARVIDAGHTSRELGSRPYFVMELVSGDPITTYCDSRRMNWRERMRLFMNVASAVHHAHQRGIIHRDLKPSNILIAEVDGVPTPKVIDFGIAKALHEPIGPNSAIVTNRMELLGTPQYMSPEQADGNLATIDIRTDVYSLGVVLYELLTGSTPLDAKSLTSASYSQMIKLIAEQRFDRPSARLTRLGDAVHAIAQQHSTDVNHLRRALRGELDWITMKALDAEPDRRYSTAQAFADDIRRYLENRPVEAAPPSAAYQVRKFVRRNRVGVVAAAVVFAAIVSGTVLAGVGLVRAKRSADQAHQINEFMREVLTSAEPEEHGVDVRLADVLQNASAAASTRFAGHPETEAQVRSLLGDVFHALDMLQPSLIEYERSIELWTMVAGPDDERTLLTQIRYGSLLGNHNSIRKMLETLDEIEPRIHRRFGQESGWSLEALRLRAVALTRQGKFDEAMQMCEEGVKLLERITVEPITRIRLYDALASVLERRLPLRDTNFLQYNQRLKEIAELLAQLSLTHLGPKSVHTLRAQFMLASAANNLGEFSTAAEVARSALAASADRFGDCHRDRIALWGVLALAQHRLGDVEDAANLCLKRIDCLRQGGNAHKLWLISEINNAIPFLDRAGKWIEGESLTKEMTEILAGYGGGHGAMDYVVRCATAHFISLQGRLDEADILYHQLAQELTALESEPVAELTFQTWHGSHLIRHARYDDAENALNEAAAILGEIRNGTWPTHPDNLIVYFIDLYEKSNRPDKVAEYVRLQQESLNPRDEQGNWVVKW